MQKKSFFLLIFFLTGLIYSSCSFSQTEEETLTITTYYPAPFGVYNEMRAKRMAVGTDIYNASVYPWGTNGPCAAMDTCLNADLAVQDKLSIGKYLLDQELIEGGGLGYRLLIKSTYGEASLVLGSRYNIDMTRIGFRRGDLADTYQIRVSHNDPSTWAGGNAFGITDSTGIAYLAIKAGKVGIGLTAPLQKLHVDEGGSAGFHPALQLSGGADQQNVNAVGIRFLTGAETDRPGKGALMYVSDGTWNKGHFVFLQNSASDASGPTLSNEVMRIGNNGYVSLWGQDASYRLELPNDGSPAGQGRANAWVIYSSGRWKENITPISNGLGIISQLNPVYFNWKKEYGGARSLGFIAEEVGKIIPELVDYEEDGIHAKSLDYAKLSAISIQGIKELDQRTTKQQKEIDALKDEIAALKR